MTKLRATTSVKREEVHDVMNIFRAVRDSNRKDLKRLISAGANVNVKNDNGDNGLTLLHTAALNDDPVIVELLLAAGAAVNARSTYGWTPLDTAVYYRHTAVVEILKEAGAKQGAGK